MRNNCPKPPKRFIEAAKNSDYGAVWYSEKGIVMIQKDGKYGWYGRPLPQMVWKTSSSVDC